MTSPNERQNARPRNARPRLALAMGCPAGVAPELTARVLADSSVTSVNDIIVIGDRRVLAKGAADAGVTLDIDIIGAGDAIPANPTRPVLVDLGHLDPATIPVSEGSMGASKFAIENFRRAILLAAAGGADAVTFTPFNKASMRLSHPSYEDEIVFLAEVLDFKGVASEFNILPNLWNARVTSHVPISKVASLITHENVLRSLKLTDQAMREGGFAKPRIAIAALNPHAGDGGNFGREDIDVLEPVAAEGKRLGIACEGPFPSDTVFVRAQKGDFDAVLTMYHDQGQIAMKLIGFDQGVTLLGGYAFPLVTAAHGSAYDIAGKGIANPGAMLNAMKLASQMASARISAAA